MEGFNFLIIYAVIAVTVISIFLMLKSAVNKKEKEHAIFADKQQVINKKRAEKRAVLQKERQVYCRSRNNRQRSQNTVSPDQYF